ncbi:MAG TPA: OmpH family outer membrane protein [Terracidiphilus sp.]|nr:OmpH family outer membrane protein [Terracidiphilus sp.]
MKHLPVVVISLALGSLPIVAAQTATGQAPAAPRPATQSPAHEGGESAGGAAKIAVIQFQAAVGQTNEFQRDFADLQKKYDPKRQQLKTLNDEIDNLTKQLQSQGANLSEEERQTKARTIDEKKKQLDRDTQDAQQDFQTDMQDLLNRLASKVGAVMTDYAQKHGYTLVLDASEQQQQAPMVLYAMPSTDITKAIIEAYNQKSGIPAPPAGAGATPDAPAPQPSTSH